jgi:hypothetical protein
VLKISILKISETIESIKKITMGNLSLYEDFLTKRNHETTIPKITKSTKATFI